MSERYLVICDDMRSALAAMEPDSVDSIVTDPPYEYGFMGKAWDRTGVAFDVETWKACLRVLKPGGHLLSFGSTRTSHRTACGIEDAGFEIRDTIAWMFGTGFPKSLDVSKAIDKAAGATTDAVTWAGWGTALKPAMEPIIVARKPFSTTVAVNVLRHGTGAINIDGCRIGTSKDVPASTSKTAQWFGSNGEVGVESGHNPNIGRWPANVILDEEAGAALDAQTGDRPGGNFPVLGATTSNIYGERKGSTSTRGKMGDSGGASRFFYSPKTSGGERDAGLDDLPIAKRGELVDRVEGTVGIDSPGAGAGRSSEGRRNTHPTVKPVSLMRYLCRLVTPPCGVVLDPFAGSGSTLVAGILEGFHVIGVEMQTDHACIAWHRVRHWAGTINIDDVDVEEKPSAGPVNLDMFDIKGSEK